MIAFVAVSVAHSVHVDLAAPAAGATVVMTSSFDDASTPEKAPVVAEHCHACLTIAMPASEAPAFALSVASVLLHAKSKSLQPYKLPAETPPPIA